MCTYVLSCTGVCCCDSGGVGWGRPQAVRGDSGGGEGEWWRLGLLRRGGDGKGMGMDSVQMVAAFREVNVFVDVIMSTCVWVGREAMGGQGGNKT